MLGAAASLARAGPTGLSELQAGLAGRPARGEGPGANSAGAWRESLPSRRIRAPAKPGAPTLFRMMAMTASLRVHGFETSNNIKVRIALGYKALEYSFHAVDPADRGGVVALSGQHLTPVLEHGGTVLFDSAAILRYLDANFPETPKLFGGGRDEQWAIEGWEFFARTELAAPMLSIIHRRVAGQSISDELRESAGADFDAALGRLEERLGRGEKERAWLVGDALTAADISAAAVLYRVENADFFSVRAASAAVVDWRDRVMAFDGKARSDGGPAA